MTTITYTIPYQVLADTRLEAITHAVGMLRTGVRAVAVVSAEPAPYGFYWDVVLAVEEDLGANDPVEPVWDLPEAADPITAAKGAEDAWSYAKRTGPVLSPDRGPDDAWWQR